MLKKIVMIVFSLVCLSSETPLKITQLLITSSEDKESADSGASEASAATEAPRACLESYEDHNGLKLKYKDTKKNYDNAEADCIADGARLVVVSSAEVTETLNGGSMTTQVWDYFIGLKQTTKGVAGTGEYTWSDGTVLRPQDQADGADRDGGYVKWNTPSVFDKDGEDDLNCIYMGRTPNWEEKDCSTDSNYVCECVP